MLLQHYDLYNVAVTFGMFVVVMRMLINWSKDKVNQLLKPWIVDSLLYNIIIILVRD